MHQFEPGHSGTNLPDKLSTIINRSLKGLTKKELLEAANLVIKGNINELIYLSRCEDASSLHVMLASVVKRVIQKGDMHALDTLLNRLVGKVKDEVEHTGNMNLPQVIVTLPDNGRGKAS